MGLTLRWIADAIHGRTRQGDAEAEYAGICTDTRALKNGEIFWALKGERFDGHDFLGDAVLKGARGVVIEAGRSVAGGKEGLVVIEVEDTLRALGECALCYRRLYDIPVVAVTGSNGKTTTKEMIASILSLKKQVLKNEGNLNNLIGLPLSLLQLAPRYHAAVVELGMNRKGEIARLTEIADPVVGLITNIGPVHLEHLESIEAVAACKGELFEHMSSEATAIINSDDPRINALAGKWTGKKVTFGIEPGAQVSARNVTSLGPKGVTFDLTIDEKVLPVYLPMVGKHNVMNALAAAATTIALGENAETIPRGLKSFTNLRLRQELVTMGDDITLINDAYNANPVSMLSALHTFAELKDSSRGIVILGDMLELGSESATLHRQLGEEVARSHAHFLLLMGEYASAVRDGAIAGGLHPDAIVIGSDHKELSDFLEASLTKGDWILVKGSRKMVMEQVAEHIRLRVESKAQRQ
jgi:UDP-N-acetylmuramoyl-tripeptide--D-alanyl-D-alanine ligase